MTRTPTLVEAVRAAIEARVFEIHTAMPGRLESFDRATQTADVQPLLRRPLVESDTPTQLPVIPKVPIVFPRGGGFFFTLPLVQGDLVLLVFNEASIDRWFAGDGEPADAGDERLHDLGDAVAFAGFYPLGRALAESDTHADNAVIGKEGAKAIHITPDGIFVGSGAAAEAMVLGSTLQTHLEAIETHLQALEDFWNAVIPGSADGGAKIVTEIKTVYAATPTPTTPETESIKHKIDE